ncbi:S8 family serine peptidase [Pelagibius sp.]|uniref:S8 family serine peptidase n=1 Tax=Pelagibius sp. TaxID=1931238 RepID=UPI00260980AD|nr:S8 family serine peptidase [Pelagibius sp.]
MAKKTRGQKSDFGNFIVLNGQKIPIQEHETDFSVHASKRHLEQDPRDYQDVASLSESMARARGKDTRDRDSLMDSVRKESVAHHVYLIEGTNEELIIDDTVILTLRNEGSGDLEKIMDDFALEYVRAMANAHVLRVTTATGQNPIKTANQVAERPEVESCVPDIMQQVRYHQLPILFPQQWYLTADLLNHPSVRANASSEVPEAWSITTGSPDIVLSVIDDGCDMGHPAFAGTRVHPDARSFVAGDLSEAPEFGDFHGTPVASIAIGSHNNQAMRGIAPGCTFLPIQIPFGRGESFVSNTSMLEVFEFVSARADVVNCSFGFPPSTFQRFPSAFRLAMTQLTQTGGRRGNGLVIVFSAGNDDSPTFLAANENINGVRFLGRRNSFTGQFDIDEIPRNRDVFTAYPMIPGLVIVAAMSSTTRKSGYSNWGPHITVAAPSSNGHELNGRVTTFTAPQRGLGQIAASNRPGQGSGSNPLTDDPSTGIDERLYTASFGGTSGAAPVVAGICGLMLSANPTLSATQVRQILEATADTDLDTGLDLPDDPNVQGISGAFVNGRSPFYGAGKANAARAVTRAQSLPGGIAGTGGGTRHGTANPGIAIPDRDPQGIVSHIELTGDGPVRAILVDVDITHTYRGDLRVNLVSPDGFVAELHRMQGSFRDDLKRAYSAATNGDLANFVTSGVDGKGRWTLHVSDNLQRDTGTLNSWSIDLRQS